MSPTARSRSIAMVAHSDFASDPRIRRQAEALAARGDRVTVFTPREPRASRPEAGITVRPLPWPRYRGGSTPLYLASYAIFILLAFLVISWRHLAHRFDLVHVHNMPNALVLAAITPRLTGTPVLLDVHDLMPELYREKFRVGAGHPMIRLLRLEERLSAVLASRVLTVTHPARDALVSHGIPRPKIDVVMNVPDPRHFSDRGDAAARRNGSPFRVVCHGTLVERLAIDVAIRACAKAAMEIPGLRFDVIGAGDHLEELHRLTRTLGAESIVHFTNAFLPIDELQARLAPAHVAIVPGRFAIYGDLALPTKLLEYAALGIPTLTADHGGVRRYFDETQTVFYPPEDAGALARALVALAGAPDRRADIASHARRFFEEYRWETHKNVYFETIERVTATS